MAGWDADGNALVVDRKVGRRVRASEQSGFLAVCEAAGYDSAVTAAPGWTVRWCKEGVDDIVDPVVAFAEDPAVHGGVPLIADLETCIVRDLRWMTQYSAERRGRQPILMPPSHES